MSKLEQQLKEIQKKLKKIEYFQEIIDNLSAVANNPQIESKDGEFKGLTLEVVQSVQGFCKSQIDEISGDKEVALPDISDINPPQKSQNCHKSVTNEPVRKEVNPVEFMQKYKHLEGKRVTVTTKDGEVSGTVIRLAIPNVLVATDTGFKATINPEKLELADE